MSKSKHFFCNYLITINTEIGKCELTAQELPEPKILPREVAQLLYLRLNSNARISELDAHMLNVNLFDPEERKEIYSIYEARGAKEPREGLDDVLKHLKARAKGLGWDHLV